MKHINAFGVSALAHDVEHLTDFVDRLENGQMLRENLDELQQTVNLLQSENHEEFYDVSTRNKKYGRVDALNGPLLLEKYKIAEFLDLDSKLTLQFFRLTPIAQAAARSAPLSNFSSRFGMK